MKNGSAASTPRPHSLHKWDWNMGWKNSGKRSDDNDDVGDDDDADDNNCNLGWMKRREEERSDDSSVRDSGALVQRRQEESWEKRNRQTADVQLSANENTNTNVNTNANKNTNTIQQEEEKWNKQTSCGALCDSKRCTVQCEVLFSEACLPNEVCFSVSVTCVPGNSVSSNCSFWRRPRCLAASFPPLIAPALHQSNTLHQSKALHQSNTFHQSKAESFTPIQH